MSFRTFRSSAFLCTLLVVSAAAACGGSAAIEPAPSGTAPAPSAGPGASPPGEGPVRPAKPIVAPQPVGPYSGAVGTTDVSILYPLPVGAASRDFVRPSEVGNHGALLPSSVFDTAFPAGRIDRVELDPPSGYAHLGVVSLRIDPCSPRVAPGARGPRAPLGPGAPPACRSEVRVVFQALYEKAAGAESDPLAGAAATDGGLHVTYDVPDAELTTLMKQLLTLKKANGDLALHELAPHPILTVQGLGGPFAQGLRAILLEHLGGARIARVTFFDHNFDPDGDGWTFGILDRSGATLVPGIIPVIEQASLLISGSSTRDSLATSSAESFSAAAQSDSVAPLVASSRPPVGAAGAAALQASLDAALNVQNPSLHTAETTDCANCHLSEGARRLGEGVYGLSAAKQFTHARSLARKDERTSVTNLHAFGYLHRRVSVMQRTANESVIVADQMEARVK